MNLKIKLNKLKFHKIQWIYKTTKIIPQKIISKNKYFPLHKLKVQKKYYLKTTQALRIEKNHRVYLNRKKIEKPNKIKKYYQLTQMIVIQKRRVINFWGLPDFSKKITKIEFLNCKTNYLNLWRMMIKINKVLLSVNSMIKISVFSNFSHEKIKIIIL
jgi:hypothetical protein